MDGFTIVDGGVAVAIVMSALLAYSRGVVREITAIAGWIAAAFVAFVFADTAQPLVRQIPYLGDMLGDSCELLIVASFAIVFALSLLLVSLFTPLFSAIVQRSIFGGFDQMLGFFFGVVARCCLGGRRVFHLLHRDAEPRYCGARDITLSRSL